MLFHRSLPSRHLLYEFRVAGLPGTYGHLLSNVAQAIAWPEAYWRVDHDKQVVTLLGANTAERTRWMEETLAGERSKGTFAVLGLWTGEQCPVHGPNRELVLSIERAAVPLLGIVAYGVQLLAYTESQDGLLRVWIARRAMTKRSFPGMLDSTVGGTLVTGETPLECVAREAEEEASFPRELTLRGAVAVGTISYLCLTDERCEGESGLLCPEIMFTYEMKVAPDVVPVPGDGEAEGFTLMSVPELKAALARGEFAPTNGEVVLDFFIRHGILTYENEPNYIEIVARLHRSHGLPAA